jgi:hypothetical protein
MVFHIKVSDSRTNSERFLTPGKAKEIALVSCVHSRHNNYKINLKGGHGMANMGTADRIIRILLSLVIVLLFFTHMISGVLATILLVIAGILLLTVIFSFCPLYAILGMRTNNKSEDPKKV